MSNLSTKMQSVKSTSTDPLKFNPELFKKSQYCSVCCRCNGEFFYTLPSQYCKICYYEYIKELQDEDEQPVKQNTQSVKSTSTTPYTGNVKKTSIQNVYKTYIISNK